MTNESVVAIEKIPFDILEVGCKYESRCGEVWEVIAKTFNEEGSRYPCSAVIEGGTFTKEGRYLFSGTKDPNDLIFKLTERNGNEVVSNDKPQDAINPSHYKHNGIETIDYMKAVSTGEEFKGHLRLTAIKYISRLGKKDCPKQEIKKAIWYLNKLLEEYEAESNE